MYPFRINYFLFPLEKPSIEIDDEPESDDEDDNDKKREDIDNFKAVVPFWKELAQSKLSTTVSWSKYNRITGPYKYPVNSPPNIKGLTRKKSAKARESLHKHSISTFNAQHTDELCSYSISQLSMKIRITEIMAANDEKISINYPVQNHYEDLFKNKFVNDNMICIMTPSYGKLANARLNYNHLMLREDGTIQPFIHLVFVRKIEFVQYQLHWGNLVGLVEIPEKMTDISENVNNGGIGYARRFIQRYFTLVGSEDIGKKFKGENVLSKSLVLNVDFNT